MLGISSGGPMGGSEPASDPHDGWRPTGPRPARTSPPDIVERDAWAVLASVHRLGPVGFGALLSRYGSGLAILHEAASPGGVDRLAQTPLRARPDEPAADARGLGPVVANAIAEATTTADKTLDRIGSLGVQVVTVDDVAYPRRLAAIEMPPLVLFVMGDTAALDPRGGRRHRRDPARDGRRSRHRHPNRNEPGRRGRHCRVRAGSRHRRRGPFRDGPGRRENDRGDRLRARAPSPLVAQPAGGVDHRCRRCRRVRAGARRRGDTGHVPAKKQGHQRSVGCDRGGRSAGAKRRTHHRVVGAGAGTGLLPRPGATRRARVRGLPGVPARVSGRRPDRRRDPDSSSTTWVWPTIWRAPA